MVFTLFKKVKLFSSKSFVFRTLRRRQSADFRELDEEERIWVDLT